MGTTVTAQTIVLLSDHSLEPDIILADSGIQYAAANSLDGDVILEYKAHSTLKAGNPSHVRSLFITFFVQPAVAATIVADIPSLLTRLQASQSQVHRIVTWGVITAFDEGK